MYFINVCTLDELITMVVNCAEFYISSLILLACEALAVSKSFSASGHII